jgi:hypothetical protein
MFTVTNPATGEVLDRIEDIASRARPAGGIE